MFIHGAIKLIGRHYLDQLVCFIIGRLLFGHLLFTYGGIYISQE
jgi:hypothetical protein